MRFSAFKIFSSFLILTAVGFFLLPELSVRLNPSKRQPIISVTYNLPYASPKVVERDITTVLEAGFATIEGVREISSKSSQGHGYITLAFDRDIHLEHARFEAATIIRQLYPNLPENASYPMITTSNPDDREASAFLSYSVFAPQSPFEIRETVKTRIEPLVGAVENVGKVQIYGATDMEYQLIYKTHQLQSLGLGTEDILNALLRQFERASLGGVFSRNGYTTISVQPSNEKIDWHFPVAKTGERVVYLDDLVSVNKKPQEARSYYRVNGKNSIGLNIFPTANANTISLAEKIDAQMQRIEQGLPPGYGINKVFDNTEYLKQELDKIYLRAFFTVSILLLFVLVASGSFRYLLLILVSCIANLGIAFLLYYACGVQIQLYSLAGITISLGLIIDNSIVVIDHLRNQKNMQIFMPVLASTLTTIGALSIIYFLDAEYRMNLVDFALVIIINLAVSLLVALFLIPTLLRKIPLLPKKRKGFSTKLKERFYSFYERFVGLLVRHKKIAILFIVLVFGIPFFMLPQKLEHNDTWFQKLYNNTMGDEWFRENARPYIDKYLGGSLRLFSYYVFENAYYGRNEETKLYVVASMEKGATVHQMNQAFVEMENYLLQYENIEQFSTQVFSGDYGRMEITFKENTASGFPYLLKNRLIRKALDLGGIDWSIYGVGEGFSNEDYGQPVNFSIIAKGYNYRNLNAWADTLKKGLETHPRVRNAVVRENSYWASEPSFRYVFELDKEKLALAGVSPLGILGELRKNTLSKYPDLFLNIQGDYLPIRLESETSKSFDIWDIKNTPLKVLENTITLKNIAQISKEREEENIYKENQEYIRRVEFQYVGTAKFGSKFLDEQLKILEKKLPLGYTFESTQYSFFQDEENNYFLLLLLVLGIVYFICAILFESLRQPFVILSVVPISFIGVFLTFYFFDFNFDQGGMAAFVLLSGVTVNASIYLLNDFNKLRKQKSFLNPQKAFVQAFRQKIFPILLTVFSTILGFVPFVMGGQDEVFWFALGAGTIGGLIFSLVGIVVFLPVFALKKR